VLGDRLVVVVLALYVTDLTGDSSDVGLVLAAQTAPLVVFLLIGGVWADRLPRAAIMMVSDVVRGVLHALLAVLIFTGGVEVWHLVAIEALFGTAEAFSRPAHSGLLPRTVPIEELQPAQALSNFSYSAAELIAPAVATGLVLAVGPAWAFLLDAGTFAVSALFLARVRVPCEPRRGGEPSTLLRDLADGFHELRARSWLWVTVTVFALAVLFVNAPLIVLGPGIAEERYHASAVFGALMTLVGVGAFAGAIAAMRWRPRHPLRAGLVVVAGAPALLVLLGLGAPLVLVLALAFATGVGYTLFDVWWSTTLAERVPPDALSRVSSYDWMGSLVLLPIGLLLVGPIADATSAATVLVAGGVLCAAVLALGLLPRGARGLRRLDPRNADA
jgi:hypothetical protein